MMTMDFETDIISCLEVLQKGGLILYPTDTVWGIGCDATNAAAVEKIYALKQRPGRKAMVVLVADERDILQFTASPDPMIFDYLEKTTRPTTVIYENALGLAENLPAEDGSIAIRICRDEFCRHLIHRFRKPLVSTSANLSGRPAPRNFQSVEPVIKNGVDHIVRHRQDDLQESTPSAIIRWVNGKAAPLRD
jgi:L-threonylcarbamoyladenylate synthase